MSVAPPRHDVPPPDDPLAEAPGHRVEAVTHADLVERYAKMAHTFERRPVDPALRALDVTLAGVALVLAAPVLALITAGMLLTGGPVLYRGPRVGRGGHIFTMYKFRTLRVDAERRLGSTYGPALTRRTVDEQTRAGRMLRASKLDELPQLVNVIRGDMSIVGPRPIRPAFFEELCESIPQYWQRLVVRPGLTGFAQLRLTREMTWAEKLAHDFEYIADRSLKLYVWIVAHTAVLVLSRPFGSLAGRPRHWA
jgi:lipopolysaccharide/colanic/teichoic acid biosynthesis glycosyltransferase